MKNLIDNQKELMNYMPVSIVMLVLTVIFLWKIFEKTGEAGWKAIIPVYNIYIIFKKFWDKSKFWITLGLIILALLATIVVSFNDSNTIGGISTIIYVISSAIILLICITLMFNIATKFDKGILFTIGLLLVPTVFLGILALDSSKYIEQPNK